ncbi:MAG: DoxX family protein [Saprospiraceae bacterium]|nr:DoxX family protein [Bacteroidia bacterium]NNF23003.1 DoxX family protein [Saprospiraceae bacterium]
MSSVNYHLASLILRIGFGLSMITGHGWGKFQTLISGEEIHFPSVLGMPPFIGLLLAVIAEFFACIVIIIGYKTKIASVFMIVTMFVAAFIIHWDDPWFSRSGGSKEMAVLYLIGFVAIYILGSGKYSLDKKYSGTF